MLFFICRILCLELGDKLTDQLVYLLLEVARQFADKFHASTATSLIVTLLEIALDKLMRFEFIFFKVLGRQRDIRQYKNLKEDLKVLFDVILIVWQSAALCQVADKRQDETLALAVSRYFVWIDLLPYLLEENISFGSEVLCKLELIKLYHTDYFRSGLPQLLDFFGC